MIGGTLQIILPSGIHKSKTSGILRSGTVDVSKFEFSKFMMLHIANGFPFCVTPFFGTGKMESPFFIYPLAPDGQNPQSCPPVFLHFPESCGRSILGFLPAGDFWKCRAYSLCHVWSDADGIPDLCRYRMCYSFCQLFKNRNHIFCNGTVLFFCFSAYADASCDLSLYK